MKVTPTFINDLFVINPNVIQDSRGYFFESYNKKALKNNLPDIVNEYNFIQDNESHSSYGTIRGLHFQTGKSAQAKLVRVVLGKVLDVAVDIRPQSSTFGKHFSVELSSENKTQLLIPEGFAHGFSVLSTEAIVLYKANNYYSPSDEGSIAYNDPSLNINWMIEQEKHIVSSKDLNAKTFKYFTEQLKSTS